MSLDVTATSAHLLWVDDLNEDSVSQAGSKIARLGELRRCGVLVPEGFVATTKVYRKFLEVTGAGERVDAAINGIGDPGNLSAGVVRQRRCPEAKRSVIGTRDPSPSRRDTLRGVRRQTKAAILDR